MQLHTLDWIIAFVSVAICFVPALFFGRRSGKNTAEFFASGRSVPWWLAGISMVATTFSSDTPNLVANFVRTQGATLDEARENLHEAAALVLDANRAMSQESLEGAAVIRETFVLPAA